MVRQRRPSSTARVLIGSLIGSLAGSLAGSLIACMLLVARRAQSQPDDSMHHSYAIPLIPETLLQRPVGLRIGIGVTHDQVSTSPRAQRLYDQGLSYLHDYVWLEAARSFYEALRLDPGVVLAAVGLSEVYEAINQSARATAVLDAIQGHGRSLGAHDSVHLTARLRQMDAERAPGDPARLNAYRRALDSALAQFPMDVELLLQRGVAESPNPADRGQGAVVSAIPYFTRALEISPDHFAAHHYLVHAYENAGRILDALGHGAAYARLAPNIPHARHMYGHDLRRVGRIREAIAEFQAADQLEAAYFKAEDIPPEYDWHYEHNVDLLATSYQYLGQFSKAEPLLRSAFLLPTGNLIQALNKRQWPAFLRAAGRNDEAMAAAAVLIGHPNRVVQAIGHIEAAHGHLLTGQFAAAEAEQRAARTALDSGVAGALLAAPAFAAVHGETLLRSGRRTEGRAELAGAITRARDAQGPDEWSQALFMLASIGRASRDAGDWEFASWVARQMLEHDSAYAGTHYALGLVAEHNADRQSAASEFTLALKYWSGADPDLPEVRDARQRLNLAIAR